MQNNNPSLAKIAGAVAASYMARNNVSVGDIPNVIQTITNSVHSSMFSVIANETVSEPADNSETVSEPADNSETANEPADQSDETPKRPHIHSSLDANKDLVEQTVFDDFIIHIPTGRKMKVLKRALTNAGMTPDAYREMYNLPDDYPIISKNYSEQRSAFSKSIGFGKKEKTSNWNGSGHGIAEGLENAITSVKDTILKDELICLLDGKKVKLLARYLKRHHGMTPDQYTKMFNLGDDYPMVHPKLSKVRRRTAKRIGLGKKSHDGIINGTTNSEKSKESMVA